MVAAGAKNKQEKSPLCLLSSSPFFWRLSVFLSLSFLPICLFLLSFFFLCLPVYTSSV
jgi:hypothetical protein